MKELNMITLKILNDEASINVEKFKIFKQTNKFITLENINSPEDELKKIKITDINKPLDYKYQDLHNMFGRVFWVEDDLVESTKKTLKEIALKHFNHIILISQKSIKLINNL